MVTRFPHCGSWGVDTISVLNQKPGRISLPCKRIPQAMDFTQQRVPPNKCQGTENPGPG